MSKTEAVMSESYHMSGRSVRKPRRPYRKFVAGKSDVVEAIYRARPKTTDATIRVVMDVVFGMGVEDNQLRVWKSSVRRKGVELADGRSG